MSDLNAKELQPARLHRQGKRIAKPSTRHQRRLFLESLEGRAMLATITIDPTFIRTVQDTAPINGTFDSFVGSSQFLRIGRSPTLNEERGIMEFDTSPIAGTIINSATLSLWHNGITLPDYTANIAVNAFAGNGVADVSDAQANNLQGSASFSLATLGDTKFVDVKSFLQQNANGSTNFAGFNLRDTTLQATQATIEIAQGGLGTELPQLTVNYTPVDSLITIDASGNLIITDHVSNADNYTIKRSGGNYIITNPSVMMGTVIPGSSGSGTATINIPAASFAGGIFFNGGGGNDTLTVDLSGGNFTPSITYNGGTQSGPPGDTLVVTGGTFANGTLNHTNATDGSVVLGTNTINYTGLEPVDITGTTVTNLVINLPDDGVTGDDTELTIAAGNLVVTSLNGTHELDVIALAGFTTVTVNARAGDDKVTLDSTMATFDKVLTLNGGVGADTFVFEASVAAAGTITVNGGAGADALDYSTYKAGGADTSVNVNLSATAANGFTGDVKVGGATITSFTEIDAVTGNSAAIADTLTGLNAAAAWTIDEATSSKYVSTGTLNFDNFERLTGGSNTDAFTVTDSGTVPFNLTGGGGTNSLNLTAIAGAKVTLTNVDAAGADGTETTKSISFTDIKTLTGDGAASLTGANAAATWIINDTATNTYATNLTFSGFNSLNGGDGVDTFNVQNNSGAIAYTLKGGAGVDAFNFGLANSLAGITNNISVDGENDAATLTLNDQGVATAQNYTATANTIGRDTGGQVTYATITNLTLNASNGANTIKLTAVPAATGTKTFNGGTGDDTLDTTGVAVNAQINNPNATKGFDGTIGAAGNFTGIEIFKGNNASTFQGDDEVATWTINDTTGNTYVSQSRTANISGYNVLQGGSKADTFNVQDNGGALAYTLNGGAGVDIFNFGLANSLAAISKDITVNGETDSANLTLNDQGVATAQNYTLTANTIGRDTGGQVTYTSITNLTLNASNGSNTIKVTAVPTATGAKTLNGGTGDDSLDLSTLAVTDVTLTAANATKGFNGTVAGVANFTGIEEIKGNGTGDLTGLNEDATWTINTATGNTYVSLSKTLKFSGFDNLNGGSKVDTYKVQDNSAPAPTYTLNGNAGGDKFLIGDTVNKLATIKNLNVIGGADVGDELTLNDQAEPGANDYTITATTAQDDGGVVVTHTTVEKITLNASSGTNAIKVVDGPYNPSTTIKLVDTTGASTLTVDDTGDVGANTWTITNASVTRTVPTPTLTIDYSSQATITNLSLAGGTKTDTVNVNSTKVATLVAGNEANDIFNVGNGDLDNLAGQVTIDGGDMEDAATRTVFSGGSVAGIVFTPGSGSEVSGDSLAVNDSQQAGVMKYAVNSVSVSRTAPAKSVNYSKIEFLSLQAGKDESDIVINLPAVVDTLPAVVSIDGGNAAKDNRVKIVGTDANEKITVGNATGVETNRSQFEVTSVTRLWVEGGKGADQIHNRSSVPGLLDGGYAKSTAAIDPGNQDDIIASDAPSTTAFSPVLLGNDGKDTMYTTNSSASGTTYLVGDYFVNNNVPLISGSATKTSRLQVVAGPGQAGDRYITNHTPVSNLRNRVLARLDTAAGTYNGRFANLTADTIGSTLGVIEWLRGRLPLTVSASGMTAELKRINYQIRLFVRDPGSPAAPTPSNRTYNPGGVASGGSYNGGEAIDEPTEAAPLVQNPFDAGDVNGDGRISAFDALLIINELNQNGAHQLDTSASGEYGVNGTTPLNFLDVNGDTAVSAFDAILIINRLNLGGTSSYVPDSFQWFVDADNAEQAAADWANQVAEQSPPANSISDDALLALLAMNDSDDDEI